MKRRAAPVPGSAAEHPERREKQQQKDDVLNQRVVGVHRPPSYRSFKSRFVFSIPPAANLKK